MRHTQPRFDATTEHLLDTADRLVIERGLRDLSLESVSNEGFASTGSVYERWRSKWHLVDELLDQRFESYWARLTNDSDALTTAERLERFESSADGRVVGTWLVEILHLTRVRPDLLPRTIAVFERLANWLSVDDSGLSDDPTSLGARWWLVAASIGQHQLRIGGASLPSLAAALAVLTAPPVDRRQVEPTEGLIDEVPGTTPPAPSDIDGVSRRIIGVTRYLLANSSGDLSVRSILGRSNVSSTTLYRRFESKRQLMLQVLNDELSSASYDWVVELVESLGTDDPIGSMARVFRRRYDTLVEFPDTRNVILELTAQARCDPDLRRTLIGQVERMADARAEIFARMESAGLLRRSLSPSMAGWLVQTPAAGYRLLVGAGVPLDADQVEAGLGRVLWNVVVD